jgi:hypothetical protein
MSTEPESGCSRQPEAGAYLLGALSPADRAGYAEHLAQCRHCLAEVGQLAGLPGLLARSPGAAADEPERAEPEPERAVTAVEDSEPSEPANPSGPEAGIGRADPLAAALDEIYRARRTRRTLVAAGFVLFAGLGVVGSALLGGVGAGQVTGVSAAARLPVQMQPVGNPPVTAAVALTERPWGTEVVMRCRYAGVPQSPVYVLVARSADGATTELARWSGVTDQDLVLASATELVGDRLAELEVRNASGNVLLRADRPS